MSNLVNDTELEQEDPFSPEERRAYHKYLTQLFDQEDQDNKKAVKTLEKFLSQKDLKEKTQKEPEEGPKLVLK